MHGDFLMTNIVDFCPMSIDIIIWSIIWSSDHLVEFSFRTTLYYKQMLVRRARVHDNGSLFQFYHQTNMIGRVQMTSSQRTVSVKSIDQYYVFILFYNSSNCAVEVLTIILNEHFLRWSQQMFSIHVVLEAINKVCLYRSLNLQWYSISNVTKVVL